MTITSVPHQTTQIPEFSAADAPSPLRSIHTNSLAALLEQLGSALLVTTYQAGKLVIARASGGVVNTRFRNLPAPMGLAHRGGRPAIGTRSDVREFHDVPAVAAKIKPAGSHDACFLPRRSHVTGNILVHEMAWAGEELWLVNTRFSCRCTLDDAHSFVPR